MNLSKQFKWYLLSVGFFLCVIVGLLVWVFITSPKSIGAPVTAALATIIVSVLSVLLTKYLERKMVIEEKHREIKIPIYDKWATTSLEFINKRKVSDKDVKELFKTNISLLVWSSEDFIKEYGKWKASTQNQTDPENTLFDFEKALMEMRKDLGHADKNIEQGDLLRIFITDVDDVLKKREERSQEDKKIV